MATQPSPEEQLLKIIKEGVPVKKPLPEEQLLKVIKQGSQAADVATSTIAPPASSAVNLKIKQPQPPPSVLPAKTDAKPSLGGAGAVAAAVPIAPPKAEPAEQPAASAPVSLLGYFKVAAQALAVRSASGAQYLAIFRRIEVINRSLAIVLVVLLSGFVYTLAFGRPSMEKTVRNLARPPVRVSKPANHEAFMSPEEYVKTSRQRDIFSREQRSAVASPAGADKPGTPRVKTDLQLVGIYFSEQPEVIIEDKAEKKTYFLKEGENIKGIKVKSIRQDRVILESDGMDWELM